MNTQTLIGFMNQSKDKIKSENQNKMRKTRLSFQLNTSRTKFIDFSNLSRTEKFSTVKKRIKQNKNQWSYQFYKGRECFSKLEQQQLQQFPTNNKKYRVQFLPRSYKGECIEIFIIAMKMPAQDLGLFPKTQRSLYSKHYQPIYDDKLKFNQNYQLRASLFGEIDLDLKKERIMDQYRLQANPFRTQRSNELLSRLRGKAP